MTKIQSNTNVRLNDTSHQDLGQAQITWRPNVCRQNRNSFHVEMGLRQWKNEHHNNPAPFPAIPAELPGVEIFQAKDHNNTNISEEEETEEQDIIENTDLDREIPNIAFGCRDTKVEEYNASNVDIIQIIG